MGWFTSNTKKNICDSPEINVKTKPLIRPGWWLTNRLPKPSRSQQPHLSTSTGPINSSSAFTGIQGTYSRTKRSDSIHQNASEAFQGHEETYRLASPTRLNSYSGGEEKAMTKRRKESAAAARMNSDLSQSGGGDGGGSDAQEAYRRAAARERRMNSGSGRYLYSY